MVGLLITKQQIEENFRKASDEEEEFAQFQLEENARIEAEWLARNEPPFADRALDDVPDDEGFDDLALKSEVYPLVGGGYAVVRPGKGFGGDLSGRVILYGEYDTSLEPLGLTYSRLNPHGVFTPDGRQIGSTCGCEDYPCCGH